VLSAARFPNAPSLRPPWFKVTAYQAAVAVAALIGVTVLGALGKVDGSVLSVIYGAVIAGALGHANGYANGKTDNKKENGG
jgi:hypothetical protein